MKQVVFAVLLLAMVSLTGCLSGDEETEDNSVYNPNKNSSINIPDNMTVVKSGNRITTDCYNVGWWENQEGVTIMDVNSNVIWNLDPDNWFISYYSVDGQMQWDSTSLEYGWEACETDYEIRININLPQEPVRFGITTSQMQTYIGTF
ncbi:MAG: hypothetical protein QGF90_01950 [Gammaproteobacteria bacterium]|jgi:hypothetical protein|nr:hypothetical protein [Gammaproteobacteria bacterium]|tara:strand:+ start:183 stop:626 length:444 start_codon:yes stop_codon:yes gene_type:complete